ncbi:type I-C CRISPR-associated protein Cas8c/Csd1 [Tumebacillus lipolyticus]|uniref:Type I-C CRISPR-associated protein Cas8c/Csd1 n=1 Tax=Tumebacillus lipolyticus TaxID=1280370 RepID=A0ABW4ZY87_9BACL
MLIQRLIQYADRLEKTPKYYEKKTVNWVIEVEPDGRAMGSAFLSMEKRFTKLVPFLSRAGTKINPILLYEKAEYALGFTAEEASEKDRAKAQEKHRGYLDLLAECAKQTGNADVLAVHRALSEIDHRKLWPPELKAGDWIVFQVDGRFPHDDVDVQTYWAEYRDRQKPTEGVTFTCIGCGQDCIPAQRHDLPIPIRGGHSKGAKLISANDRAYFSYGLENSLIAPTCEECATKYAKALIHLLSDEFSHVVHRDLSYVFWTKEKASYNIAGLVKNPEPKEVQEFLTLQKGKRTERVKTNQFYAAALSPYISRIVVRDWMETTLERVQESLVRWFRLQMVIGGGEERFFGTYTLAASLYRDANKEMESNVPMYFLNHAMHGKPLPSSLLLQAVQRCKAEQRVTAPRAVVMQLCLLQDATSEEEKLMKHEQQKRDPAFLCGQLFAHLDHVQQVAIGPNATLVDRYYGTASTAPASVFGFLVRNAQNHLGKIRKLRYNQYVNLNRVIGEVMDQIKDQIEDFPKLLKPEKQALFALGFYHQQQIRFKKAEKKVAGEE